MAMIKFAPHNVLLAPYNILLFGETGSGKSTWINYVANKFLGGSLENMKIAIPTKHHPKATESWKHCEKDLHDSTKSKTSECTVYDFTRGNCRYNFIDTPGLSDTEGTERDDQHIEKIMSAAEKIGTLSAIIIVINGTVARATVNLRNTLVRLRGSVPDVLLNNLLVVLTNCYETTANFELESLKPWTVPEDNVFHMNNSALSKPMKDWISSTKLKSALYKDWQASMEEIDRIIQKINQLGHIATNAFGDMRKKRDKIKAELHGILLEVKKLQTLQSELEAAKLAEKDAATNIQKYADYKKTKTVDYVEMEPADYHSTICTTHNEVCHDGCGLVFTTSIGNDIFKGCSCMSGSKCGVCGCDHSTHYHDKKKPVRKTKTVDEILRDIKDLHDQHSNTKNKLQKQIGTLSADITALQQALKRKEGEIQQCCHSLKSLCSHFNFVDELKSVIDTLEVNARTLTSVQVRAQADNMIKSIKHLADQLSQSQRSYVSDVLQVRRTF